MDMGFAVSFLLLLAYRAEQAVTLDRRTAGLQCGIANQICPHHDSTIRLGRCKSCVLVKPTMQGCHAGLKSQNWGTKQASANAIADMAASGAENLREHATQLAAALMAELPGRLWEGKASVLKALAALCKACPSAFSSVDQSSGASDTAGLTVVQALYGAAGRQNAAYRQAALVALEIVLTALQTDFLSVVSPLVVEGCINAKPAEAPKVGPLL